MRFTTDSNLASPNNLTALRLGENRPKNTTEEFECVYGYALFYCFGFYLPYDILKKYEEEEEVNFTVRMRIVDDSIVMRV
jgi:hypothetical protein